jgi:hypothetical protein
MLLRLDRHAEALEFAKDLLHECLPRNPHKKARWLKRDLAKELLGVCLEAAQRLGRMDEVKGLTE